MIDRFGALSVRFRHAAVLGALALVVFVSLAFSTREWTPVFDETEYLNAAYSLVHHGIVSTHGPGGPVAPTATREPGYPVFIAAIMLVDPGLKKFTPACNAPPDPKCAPYYRSLQYANSALIVLTGVLLFITVLIVTGRYPPAYIAALLVFLNVEANEMRHQILSDYLAMATTAGAMVFIAIALVHHRRGSWLLVGLALAALSRGTQGRCGRGWRAYALVRPLRRRQRSISKAPAMPPASARAGRAVSW